MAKQTPTELLANLRQFSGTTQWWKHPVFPNYRYTDGVRYLAINAEAYWLIEYIISRQLHPKIKGVAHQTWKIEVENSKAAITVDDGNGKILAVFEVSYTDFPLDSFKIWVIDNVLLLPSEY